MKIKNLITALLVCTISSVSLVTILYALSEDIVHRKNSFFRRYPHHPATKQQVMDINFNSYYIAGVTEDSIYLGNHTAPLHILAIDKKLKDSTHMKLSLEEVDKYKFRSVKVNVLEPYFYLSDGTVPIIYRGRLGEWRGKIIMEGEVYFSQFVPTNKNQFVFRARSTVNNENELGKIILNDSINVELYPSLLEKQIDGIFDTDGFLFFNHHLEKVIYSYRYRNQFIVANRELDLGYRGRTIDIISQAQLDIAEISSRNQKTLGSKSITVTHNAATSGNYLFTSSERLGKYESEKMLAQASIIDVYNLQLKTYDLSFYLYHYQKEKMREFAVKDNQLYALMGKYLISHSLNPDYFKFETNKNISADIRSKTENL